MEYYSHICLAAIGGLRADATHRFDFNLDLDIQFGASLMALLTNSWPRAEQNRDRGGMQGEEGRGGSWSHKTPIAVAHHTTSMCAELCKQADSKHTQHHQFQACSSGQPLPLPPPSPLFCLIGNYHSRASELCPMANVLPIIRRAWWLLHSSPQSRFHCKFHSPRRSWNISSENRPDSNLAHAVSIDDAVVVVVAVVDADLDVLFGCKIFAARPFNKLTRR